jgi:hypothetical protein
MQALAAPALRKDRFMKTAARATSVAVLVVLMLLPAFVSARGAAAAEEPTIRIEQVLAVSQHERLLPWATEKVEELCSMLETVRDGSSARLAAPAAERCYMELELIGTRIGMLPRPGGAEAARLAPLAQRFEQARARIGEQVVRIRSNPALAASLRGVIEPVYAQVRGQINSQSSVLASQLQTLRSQIELYKLQHRDQAPDFRAHGWDQLTRRTDEAGTVQPRGKFGPYLQGPVANALTGSSRILIVRGQPSPSFRYDKGDGGFFYDESSGRIWAVGADGRVFDENGAFSSGR